MLSKDVAPSFALRNLISSLSPATGWCWRRGQTAESSCHMNSLRQKLSHPVKVYCQWLTVLFVLLRHQRSGAFGYSSEEIHPDPAEVHQERVEAGKDRLCGYRRVCPLLVTVRLRHTHFLGRVRHISELMLGFQIHGDRPQSAACFYFTTGNRSAIVWWFFWQTCHSSNFTFHHASGEIRVGKSRVETQWRSDGFDEAQSGIAPCFLATLLQNKLLLSACCHSSHVHLFVAENPPDGLALCRENLDTYPGHSTFPHGIKLTGRATTRLMWIRHRMRYKKIGWNRGARG